MERRAAQREIFFNQAKNSPLRGIEPGTWRCYSEALTITLEALSQHHELLHPEHARSLFTLL
jgi:hypothetical protein